MGFARRLILSLLLLATPVLAQEEVHVVPLEFIQVSGQTNVTTAGTQVALTTSTSVGSCSVKALVGNTNNIYIGDSTVSSSDGYILDSGEAWDVDIVDPSEIFIDSDTNGEGVSWVCTK